MVILTLRTDKPEAELGLYDGQTQLGYVSWAAHRELAETIHSKIEQLLFDQKMTIKNIEAIVCFRGPGSFTGLRIGLSVANALAMSLKVPIVAAKDPDWIERGCTRIENGETDIQAAPYYGSDPHVTP